jgi:hypothetical protein
MAFGARDAHLTLIADAVFVVGLLFVGEGVAVAGGPADRVVAAEVPEPAVVGVPGDGAATSEVGVDGQLIEVECVGVMVEVDDRVRADVWACDLDAGARRDRGCRSKTR